MVANRGDTSIYGKRATTKVSNTTTETAKSNVGLNTAKTMSAEKPVTNVTLKETIKTSLKPKTSVNATETEKKAAKPVLKKAGEAATKPIVKTAVKPAKPAVKETVAEVAVTKVAKPKPKVAAKPVTAGTAKSVAKPALKTTKAVTGEKAAPVLKPVGTSVAKPAAKPTVKAAAKPATKTTTKVATKTSIKSAAKPQVAKTKVAKPKTAVTKKAQPARKQAPAKQGLEKNVKAIKFQEFLIDNNIGVFSTESMPDEVQTVIFRSKVETKGQILPVAVFIDTSIFTIIRTQVVTGIAPDKWKEIKDFLNELNSRFKVFKYYLKEDGAIYLDICLPFVDETFDSNMVRLMLSVLVKHLNTCYDELMSHVWN